MLVLDMNPFLSIFLLIACLANPFSSFAEYNKKALRTLEPLLLPIDHPLKPAMDQIFHAKRVTLNDATLAEAGFVTLYFQPRSFIRVLSHPELPKHLLKLCPDSESRLKKGLPDWHWLAKRCQSAHRIQEIIVAEKIKHFTVPLKFIYLLPEIPAPPQSPEYSPKIALLIVQDMNLVSKEENLAFWKEKITKSHLKELFTILKSTPGMSAREDNIVLTKKGKLAFIDTEFYYIRPNFQAILPYLSPEMQAYWKKLVKKN